MDSGGKVLRVLLGTYEPAMTRLVLDHLGRGGTFLDVGAHVGFYTLLASRRVAAMGQVWSFEPAPRNVRYLRLHVQVNGLGNVRVEEVAVAEEAGRARFGGGSGSGTGRLSGSGGIDVRTVALDPFCDRYSIVPTVIKIDVEGAEAAVLRGGLEMLRGARPVLFLSTHGPQIHAECADLLHHLGYQATAIRGGGGDPAAEALWLP